MKNIIVAYSKNRVIGYKGKIPWQGELPADMKHFRETTMGTAIIMGRLTFESIDMPLSGRDNIVLSSTSNQIEGCQVAKDLDEAYKLVRDGQDSFVIGGESVYRDAIDRVDRLYVTEVDADKKGDRYFPAIDAEKWRIISEEEHQRDDRNRYNYKFIIYEALR